MTMTARQRVIDTLHFRPTDRYPYQFGGPRTSTWQAWHLQGLPDQLEGAAFHRWVGADVPPEDAPVLPYPDFQARPRFQPRTLQVVGDKKIWIDDMGVKRIDHLKPPTSGFETRRYLEFPVTDRSSFLRMAERFRPDPARVPEEYRRHAPLLADRDWSFYFAAPGLFWKIRDWVGFENLCMMFVDNPRLVHEMMEFWTDFLRAVLDDVLRVVTPEYIFLNEDMAYKSASMISPAMCREFLVPRWKRIVEGIKSRGVPAAVMDCDGHVSELVPLWIECGFDAAWPFEAAAGNDAVAVRRRYGKSVAILGSIDKRPLMKDKAAVRREVMSKVPFLASGGGYVPEVDHGVPPDAKLRNYLYLAELLKALAEGRDANAIEKSPLEDDLGPVRQEWTPDMALPHDEDSQS